MIEIRKIFFISFSFGFFFLIIPFVSAIDISACSVLDQTGATYFLTADVSSEGTCFTISAHNITLDCQNYRVNYSTSVAGYAINNSAGYDNIIIKNCKIVQGSTLGSCYAIYAFGMVNSTIYNSTITTSGSSGHGIYLSSDSSYNNLTSNNITTSGSDGYGIFFSGSNYNNLTGNNITTSGSDGYGIWLYLSSNYNNLISNNITTSGSDGYGIWLYLSSNYNNLISNNITTSGSDGFGIYFSSSNYNNLTSNNITTSGSDGYGIWLYLSSNNNLTSNNITTSGSDGFGIYLALSSNASLTRNNITVSTLISKGLGLYIFGDSASHYIHEIDESNTVNNRPVKYYKHISNMVIAHNHTWATLIVASSTNITITNITTSPWGMIQAGNLTKSNISFNRLNTTAGYGHGIFLSISVNNTLAYNNITTSGSYGYGIWLYLSSNNNLTSNNITTSGSDGYGIWLYLSSNNNLTSNNITTSGSDGYGIYLYSNSNYNNFISNSITTSGSDGYGIYLRSSFHNSIAGGSIISRLSYDYYLRDAETTNNFTATNFTALRRIYFYDTTSWFNYRNESDGIWIKTNVSAEQFINRTLIRWSQAEITWNESAGSSITARYNITGLLPNTEYNVYNFTVLAYSLVTDSDGNLPSFTIALNTTTREIKVNATADLPPTYSLNSTNSTLAGTPVLHSLFWQDNVGLSYAIFSFDNCTGTLSNITGMSLTGTSAWSNFTVTINSTVGCTIRWCVYVNDTSNNWNGTSCDNPFSYVTTAYKKIKFIIVNDGTVNLGKNFTVQYEINNVLYTTTITLNQDLTPGSSAAISIPVTTSGSLQWIKVYSSICPGQVAEKKITGVTC